MEKPEGNAVDCKKRKTDVDEDEDLDDFSPDELAKLSRSERKRHREKKRRSDVNKGFDDLMTLLLEIDPTVRTEAEERSRRGNWKGTYGAEDNLLSRVDLIDRAVEVLRRIHCENEDRKLMISSLTRSKGSEGSLDIGFLAQPASQNRSLAAATNPTNQERSMLAQRLPTSNDSYALQAAIESSQYYSQPLLRGLSSQQSSAANRSLQQDVLSLSGQMHLNRNNNDMLRFAGGSFLGGHGLAVNDASNLNVNPHQSLFASSLGPTIQALNLSNSADLGSLGITRQYLELLQNQQTAASLAHLAGVGNSQGDAALQRFANDRQNNGRQN